MKRALFFLILFGGSCNSRPEAVEEDLQQDGILWDEVLLLQQNGQYLIDTCRSSRHLSGSEGKLQLPGISWPYNFMKPAVLHWDLDDNPGLATDTL